MYHSNKIGKVRTVVLIILKALPGIICRHHSRWRCKKSIVEFDLNVIYVNSICSIGCVLFVMAIH